MKAKSIARQGDQQQQEITLLSKTEDNWLDARVRGETSFSGELLDDAYQGATSDGVLQTKADFIQSIGTWARDLTHGEHAGRSIRIHGDVALSSGIVNLSSVRRRHSFRYLRIFLRRRDGWRLIASQSTRQKAN
jgi:hypothetical protein